MSAFVSKKSAPLLLCTKWFDAVFPIENGITSQIRDAAILICKEFRISGSSDPGYIANCIAVAFGVGDGSSKFTGELVPIDVSVVDFLDGKFKFAYSSKIPKDATELREILMAMMLKNLDVAPAPKYRYGLMNRPAGLGAVPKGNFTLEPQLTSSTGRAISRHGVIVYDRKLTEEEIYGFELCVIAESDTLKDVMLKISTDMSDYAAEYVDMMRDDRAGFHEAVDSALLRCKKYRIFIEDMSSFCNSVFSRLSLIAKYGALTT